VVDQCAEAPVFRCIGRDSIFYAPSLESFLVNDIFKGGRITNRRDDSAVEVKFCWMMKRNNVIEAEGEI